MEESKIALVTGAGKGIGAAVAIELAECGFDIWLNYRSDHDSAGYVAEKIEKSGRTCIKLPFDVADADAVHHSLDPLLKKDTPFALINNAGVTRDTLLALMSEEEWQSVISVTLDGFYRITKPVVKNMLKKRKGRIVNIASTSGQSGVPGQVNYSAAKAGLIGATKSLAAEVARRNILVNAIAPGFIETGMTSAIPKDKVLPAIPMNRFGTPEEVAHIAAFLCSEKASYITGQVIAVNGGLYM